MVNFLKENFVYRFLTQNLLDLEIANVEYVYTFGDHLAVNLDEPTMDFKLLFENFYSYIVVQHGEFVTDRSKLDPKYESIVIIPNDDREILDTYRVLPNQHP